MLGKEGDADPSHNSLFPYKTLQILRLKAGDVFGGWVEGAKATFSVKRIDPVRIVVRQGFVDILMFHA